MKLYKIIKIIVLVVSVILVIVAAVSVFNLNSVHKRIFSFSTVDNFPEKLFGSWVEPIPGDEKTFQGFRLFADGSAESINMATLVYQAWKVTDGALTLTAQSIGNRTSSVGTEIYEIVSISKEKLIIKNGEYQIIYRRL